MSPCIYPVLNEDVIFATIVSVAIACLFGAKTFIPLLPEMILLASLTEEPNGLAA